MTTTPGRVRSMSKEMASLSDDQLNMYIEDASLEVFFLNVKEEQKERLTRYLAAHLAFVNIKRVKSEKVGELARTYADSSSESGLNSTPFGQEYQRIIAGPPVKKSLNLTVL
ncbi:DUF4054 domain-containing protein [Peribacillus sp. B-H-3]|uniref:DUF4054 domain-containing protein n=1 Tax=Peribacillus sp. B-H-3 TaxID=3400420 RepID=UPI003B01AEF8